MAANCTPTEEILNPCTPLAFLPPDIASQVQMSRCVFWATVGAFMWDWIVSLPDEVTILRKSGIRLPIVAYMISRLGTLSYISTAATYQSFPGSVHGSCQPVLLILCCSFLFALPGTAALFFFRVRAVYDKSKAVTVIFGILWLATLGAAIVFPFSVKGEHVGPTDYCLLSSVAPVTAAAAGMINTFSDTLVFLAISWRIARHNTTGETWGEHLRSFYKGDGLPRLSKILLQSGQAYYLATVGLNIATHIMVLDSMAPSVYRAFLSVPNIALESSMACRVYRAVYLGTIRSTITSRSHFVTSTELGTRMPPGVQSEDGSRVAIRSQLYDDLRTTPLNITITTDSSRDDTNKKHSYMPDQD